MKTCSIESCPNAHYARTWCSGHYKRWLKVGDVRASEPLGRYGAEANKRNADRLRGKARGPMPDEWKEAIRAAKKGRGNGLIGRPTSNVTREKIGASNSASGNGKWKGDEVGYIALHDRVRKLLPKVCAHCGATNRLEAALRRDAIGPLRTDEMKVGGVMRVVRFSLLTEDYVRLCVPCHRTYDLKKESA